MCFSQSEISAHFSPRLSTDYIITGKRTLQDITVIASRLFRSLFCPATVENTSFFSGLYSVRGLLYRTFTRNSPMSSANSLQNPPQNVPSSSSVLSSSYLFPFLSTSSSSTLVLLCLPHCRYFLYLVHPYLQT